MNYKSTHNVNRFLSLVFAIILSLVFFSCRFEVPIKELSQAKLTISRAVEVKADKYAPDELKEAKQHLIKSHDYIKEEDGDKAKEEANKSINSANDAITKSLPLLANDYLIEAKKIYDEAVLAYAEKYSPDELKSADDLIKVSETLIKDGKFWESYLNSKEAIGHATNAKDKALANIPDLNEWITKITDEATLLESNRGIEFASEDIALIKTNLSDANSLIANEYLKDAYPKIIEAEEALKRATILTQRGIAEDGIRIAEDSLKKVEESEHKKSFIKDIEKASLLISNSKDLFEKESYEESIQKSNEAFILLNSLMIAMEKKAEEIRLEPEREKIETGEEGKGLFPKEYVVKLNPKKRDCLWRIAHYMYKNAKMWPLIYMANRDQIKDPDLIFPGQRFKIPPIPVKKEIDKQDEIEDVAIEDEPSAEFEAPATDEKKQTEEATGEGPPATTIDELIEDVKEEEETPKEEKTPSDIDESTEDKREQIEETIETGPPTTTADELIQEEKEETTDESVETESGK